MRSGPAENTPPTSSSAISVVVTSITPASRPESTSFSIDWPPVPVAWKVRQSYCSSSALVTACTQGVVTPNMVRPMAGLVVVWLLSRGAFRIMPASAWAALDSTRSEMRLMPETSVTAYIMQMSAGPTYGLTSPEATVDTMTFGTPMGRRRMAAVASAVPPDPPAEMMPPRSRRVPMKRSKALPISTTAEPRSPVNTACAPPG